MTAQVYSSHQQTRQQLDELDALLQRMLSLPMNSGDSGGPTLDDVRASEFTALPPTLPQAPPAPQNSGSIVHAWRLSTPVMPAEQPPMAVAVEDVPMAFAPPAPAPYPYSMVYGQPLPAESAPIPPVAVPVVPPAVAAPPAAQPAWAIPVTTGREESPSVFKIPFVVINQLFDALSYLLGPLGVWLRSPAGGRVMGTLGVLMILGAAAWTAFDVFGKSWTP